MPHELQGLPSVGFASLFPLGERMLNPISMQRHAVSGKVSDAAAAGREEVALTLVVCR